MLDGCTVTLKQEPVDEFSPSEEELFQHHYHHLTSHGSHCGGHSHHHHHHHHHQTGPPRPPMPPPYHLHQYMGSGPGALLHLQSQQQSPPSGLLAQPKPTGLVEQQVGDREDVFSDKQVCRWIDCSAAYEQQEELVRHIEKVHIDQRKGEDFTCFWAGCVRRYKPFNARYKLLIHMRVHSERNLTNAWWVSTIFSWLSKVHDFQQFPIMKFIEVIIAGSWNGLENAYAVFQTELFLLESSLALIWVESWGNQMPV